MKMAYLNGKTMNKVDSNTKWSSTVLADKIEGTTVSLLVVAKPIDGSDAVELKSSYKIISLPQVKVDYDRSVVDKKQIIVFTSSAELSDVSIVFADGKITPFKTVDKINYIINVQLPSSNKIAPKVVAKDDKGFNYEKTLFVNDSDEKRQYSIKQINYMEVVCSTNAEEKDFREEYILNLDRRPYKDAFFDQIKSKDPEALFHFYSFGFTNSPDQTKALISFGQGLSQLSKYQDSGRIIEHVKADYTLLLGYRSGELIKIWEPFYHIKYKPTARASNDLYKERGKKHLLVLWNTDQEIIFHEIVPEDKFYGEGYLNPNINFQIDFVPYVKTRFVKYSLIDGSFTEMPELKSPTPWVVYGDANGIRGYSDIYDKDGNKNTDMYAFGPKYICDILSGKCVELKPIIDKVQYEGYKPPTYDIFHSYKLTNKSYAIVQVDNVLNKEYYENDPRIVKSTLILVNINDNTNQRMSLPAEFEELDRNYLKTGGYILNNEIPILRIRDSKRKFIFEYEIKDNYLSLYKKYSIGGTER
jgi:hypothetical protein